MNGDEMRERLAEALDNELDVLGLSGELSDRASEYLADAVLPVIEECAARREAEALEEALAISTWRSPLHAVAWMARRQVSLRADSLPPDGQP